MDLGVPLHLKSDSSTALLTRNQHFIFGLLKYLCIGLLYLTKSRSNSNLGEERKETIEDILYRVPW